MSRKKLISIVTPVYNEAENIPLLWSSLRRVCAKLPYTFEVVFVDDGSEDTSVLAVERLRGKLFQKQLVCLSRNFGKEAAVAAGLARARGEAVIVMDADLQHPTSKIPEFIKQWEQGAQVVVGVRLSHGKDSLLKSFLAELFYKIMNKISDTHVIPHSTDFRLIDREVADAFNQLPERNRMTRSLVDWLGFDRAVVEFSAEKRIHGAAGYGYRKLTHLAINAFISHSFVPLRFAGYLGGCITLGAGLLGTFLFVQSVLLHDPLRLKVTGTAMLAVMTIFLVGIVLSCLGLFAYYIAAIYDEAMARPLYIVRKARRR